jgi:hypothetical protein
MPCCIGRYRQGYLLTLARYKDTIIGDRKIATHSLAKKFYRLASKLMPENGNTYNQLGVLETYIDRPSFALDLYLKRLPPI